MTSTTGTFNTSNASFGYQGSKWGVTLPHSEFLTQPDLANRIKTIEKAITVLQTCVGFYRLFKNIPRCSFN
ncbi:MAG: hypothetical protein H0X51_07555 [Parachlamydiaceae bacterium]|nr:hypothetical protein [Parachlamydiaceae bacterium]